jgi:hypothetical protein
MLVIIYDLRGAIEAAALEARPHQRVAVEVEVTVIIFDNLVQPALQVFGDTGEPRPQAMGD